MIHSVTGPDTGFTHTSGGDEEAYYLTTLQWHRIVVHNARVRGWTVTPSHYINQQLDGVWLVE